MNEDQHDPSRRKVIASAAALAVGSTLGNESAASADRSVKHKPAMPPPAGQSPPSVEGVQLFAFTVGWLTLPLSFFLVGETGNITVPCTAYLIQHPKGLAVFDTGLGPRFERPAGTPATGPADLEDDGNIGQRLRAMGVDPADVKWIINSHLHTDHAGGNVHLPNASVVVQMAEHSFAHGPGSQDQAYHRPEFDLGHPVLRIQGEHDLFGDGSVVLFPTPGHTPGHQCARVRVGRAQVVLAADCCNLKRSLDEFRLPDHVHDADQALGTLRLLRNMRDQGTHIFYGHDPDFWKTLPKVVPLTNTTDRLQPT
jgi:glyoxylase-like metal-dependent hydrolase (beta-lactamase superfamily II)